MSATGRTIGIAIEPKHSLMIAILHAERQVAILPGRPDVGPGDKAVLYCLNPPFAVEANIWGTRTCSLGNLAPDEIKAGGHTHVGNLLGHLQQNDPRLTLASEVTIVRWTNVKGELARQVDGFELNPSTVVGRMYQTL